MPRENPDADVVFGCRRPHCEKLGFIVQSGLERGFFTRRIYESVTHLAVST
jgi:hypothetical protein